MREIPAGFLIDRWMEYRPGSFGKRPTLMSPISSNWPSQRRLSLWYAITLGLLLLNGVVTCWNLRTISKGADQIARTNDVIKSLDDLLLDFRASETGQRGFLLTGDEAYLAPYNKATATIDAAMERLKVLTAADPVSRSRADVDEVERLARAKLAELAKTIGLRREQRGEAALVVVKSGRGRALMTEIVDRITAMENEETVARGQLNKAEAEAISQTTLTFGLATGLALGLVAVIRHLSQRSRRELALRAEWLSTTLQSIGDAVIAADADGRVTLMNAVAEQLTGWTASDAIGKDLDAVLPIRDEHALRPASTRCAGCWKRVEARGSPSRRSFTPRTASNGPSTTSPRRSATTRTRFGASSWSSATSRSGGSTSTSASGSIKSCATTTRGRTNSWPCSPTSCAIPLRRSAAP